jgi:radical SAM protein with 4Fe4S-binding SPASM domain
MANFNLDGHKLQYHPQILADFLSGKDIYPVYVEISPQANCNHRCLFCHYNYLGHEGAFPKGRMLGLVRELAALKVKSLVFAGTGEPLLHPETMLAIKLAKSLGIDVAMSTNGALIKESDAGDLVNSLTWVRFSFNGGNAENYALMHGSKKEDYSRVLENIRCLKAKKKELKSALTIGIQFILLPQNKDFLLDIAKVMKDIGVDYFVVKHFYAHPQNKFASLSGWLTESALRGLQLAAQKLSDDKFAFIIRDSKNLSPQRIYKQCLGLPFIAYIREDGEVYTCFSYQHDKNTSLGNIRDKSFREIWSGRLRAADYINQRINKNKCQPNCRHHQINHYLWEIKNPTIEHVNFI